MSGFTSEFKVGIFVIAAIGVLVYFTLRTDDRPLGFGQELVLVKAKVPSVDGVQLGTAVEIAGVKVGAVREIHLSDNSKPEVIMEIEPRYKLPVDTGLTMKTRGLLGDRFIQLLPGESEEMVGMNGALNNYDKGLDVDALTVRAETISADVEAITGSLKTLLAEGEEQGKIQNIIDNLETVSEQLPQLTTSTQADMNKVVASVAQLTEQMQTLIKSADAILNQTNQSLQGQMDNLNGVTAKLDKSLENIEAITAKIEGGEGTVGALLTDRTLLTQVEDTVEDVSDLVGTVSRMKSTVAYRGEMFLGGSPTYQYDSRNALEVSLMPREDYGYIIELVSDPGGSYSEEQVIYEGTYYDGTTVPEGETQVYTTRRITDDFLYSFQFMRRWDQGALRFGIKYNTGALGADYFMMDDRLALRADLFNFRTGQMPNLKVQAQMNILRGLYLGVGMDDSLNGIDGWARGANSMRGTPYGPNIFLGAGFSFEDDDLKLLMTMMPSL